MEHLYLYVAMTDPWGAYNDAMCGIQNGEHTRVVEVPLTDEQMRLIEPRKVGSSAGNDHHERISPISIQRRAAQQEQDDG